jgi:hypothetical protein
MSLGNGNPKEGDKGSNFNYELKVLQGLQSIINNVLAGIDVNITGTGVQRTPTFLRPSGTSGTIGAGVYSISFASVGTANATVGGIILKPGESLNFDAGAINNTLAAIAYSTTTAGAELIIITIT